MKNYLKVFGIIVLSMMIGFSMTACDDGGDDGYNVTIKSTNGLLTITGIPAEYNGKWICGSSENGSIELIAYQQISKSSSTGALISNGGATLNVWKVEYPDENSVIADNYNGSDKNVYFYFDIINKATHSSGTDFIGEGRATVNFTNGVGTGTFVKD